MLYRILIITKLYNNQEVKSYLCIHYSDKNVHYFDSEPNATIFNTDEIFDMYDRALEKSYIDVDSRLAIEYNSGGGWHELTNINMDAILTELCNVN